MIELRWTWKEQTDGILAGECLAIDAPQLHPMLQYRYRFPLGSDPITAYPPHDWHWSEWIDVPLPEKPC